MPTSGNKCRYFQTNVASGAPIIQARKQDRYGRLIRKAKDLRRRLGDTSRVTPIDHAHMANYPPNKPPRMLWRTYSRLACDLRQTETEVANLIIAQSQRFLDRMKGKGAYSP